MAGTESSNQTPKDAKDNGLSNICRPKVLTLQKKDHTLCAVCVEIGQSHQTMTYCFDCGRTMCKMCNLNHQQISAFRDHVRITLVDEGSEDVVEEKLQSLVCVDHDNMIQKYCWDCSSPVCSVCLIFEHKDHTIKAFAYKPRDQEENYEELRAMIETKMSDLQTKMEKIHCLKAQQPHNHCLAQDKVHNENVLNQVNSQEQELSLEDDVEHEEKQENLAQVQQKVGRAKRMVDVLLNRAGAVHRKQAELERLQALKEQVRQLDQSLPGAGGDTVRPTLPKGLTEEALVDTLMQQAKVVKQKQDELAKLKGLREQLRQIELSSLAKALEYDDDTAPAQDPFSGADPKPVDVIDMPSLTDRDLIMAIIKNIGDQIPRFKEESVQNEIQTSFVPWDLAFNLETVQAPEPPGATWTSSSVSHHPEKSNIKSTKQENTRK